MLCLPFVMEFVVYLTNRCNLRCEMCTQYGENYKENAGKELSFEQWQPFFDSISDTDPKPKVILIGGEPLLYKDFDRVLEYLNSKGVQLQIVTNGVFLDKHFEAISKCQNLTITVSIDGLPELHDKIRGVKGTFEKALKNIHELNRLRQGNNNIKIYVNSVLLPENLHSTTKFLQYIQKQGVDQVVFQHLQFSSKELNERSDKAWHCRLNSHFDLNTFITTQKDYKLDLEFVKKLQSTIDNLNKVCNIEAFVFPYLSNEETKKYYSGKDLKSIRSFQRCSTPWVTGFVTPEGDVSNCINNCLGNITEKDFWELWNGEKAQKFRDELCKGGNFEICSRCCNFYKSGFLYGKDAKVNIKGKELKLPAELNYINACPDGVFVLDKSQSTDSELYATPCEIYSEKMLNDIKQHNEILGFFSETGD